MAAENTAFLMNGHTNGVMTNGHHNSDGDTDRQSESSTTSSTRNLTENRGLPPVPKIELPPPLPKDPPRQDKLPSRIRTSRPPTNTKFIPENEITIPKDGSLAAFTTEEMCTFFRHLGVEDRIVNHLQRKELTGRKFSSLKDADLETIGIKNPIICHFRDKSKSKKGVPFML